MKKRVLIFIAVIMLFSGSVGVSSAANRELDQQLILFANGDFDTVKQLVAQGADVNARNQNGETPLMSAASQGMTEIAAFLISKGAAVNGKNNRGITPLICAVNSGKTELVRLLIGKGADVNAKDSAGHNAAYYAVMWQRYDLADMLTAAGKSTAGSEENPSQTQKELDEAVFFAMGNKDYNRVMQLIERGAAVNASHPSDGNSLLHDAVFQGNLTMAEYLIGKGSDVNMRNQKGETPLYNALWLKQTEMVKLLLNQGAKTAIKNGFDQSPLYHFVIGCYEKFSAEDRQIAELLIQWGANIKEKNCFDHSFDGNQTALHQAALSGNRGLAGFLLEKGADINARNIRGLTPLHYGVSSGNPEVVALLIAKGADLNMRDVNGKTPLSWAKVKNYPVIVAMLMKAGAK